ncbi:MAG: hypothetical protein OXN92_00875 [Gammaproteobacteria bacterium]|nr:hypothetical protein [Gammaproteobacteria bacterium]
MSNEQFRQEVVQRLDAVDDRLDAMEMLLVAMEKRMDATESLLEMVTKTTVRIWNRMATKEDIQGLETTLEDFRSEWKKDIQDERAW